MTTTGTRTRSLPGQPDREAAAGPMPGFGVSVAECLRIAPLDRAVVLAGHAGLSRRMNWVHVVDHRDMEDSLDTHELLLTSGIALAGDATLRKEIFGIMDRRNAAGLVISIGEYIAEVPQEMRELADIFEIPLIAIPWEVNFGDITRVLLTRFVESQYRFMELSQELNRELLAIVLAKGDLQAVSDCIARVTGAGAAICGETFKRLAVSASGDGGPAGATLLSDPALRNALSATAFNRGGRAAAQILTLDGNAIGIAAPISIAERRRGYIVMETGGHAPGPIGRLGELSATVAALVIAHEDELLRVARRADGQLIGVLEGTLPPSAATLAEIGLKTADPVTVLVVDLETGDLPLALDATGDFLRRHAGGCALAIRGRSVVGLVQRPRGRHAEWAAGLAGHLRGLALAPLIGISGPIPAFGDIPGQHEDVKELMWLRHFLQPDEDVVNTEHATVLLRALRNLTAGGDLETVCPSILKIREHDRSQHGSLIEALACLLEVDWNVSLAARRLRIHRHTILYRLNRISEILGTELKPSMRFELRLQLLAWRLSGRT